MVDSDGAKLIGMLRTIVLLALLCGALATPFTADGEFEFEESGEAMVDSDGEFAAENDLDESEQDFAGQFEQDSAQLGDYGAENDEDFDESEDEFAGEFEQNSAELGEFEEDEEVAPALLLAGKIAGDLAIEWTAAAIWDFATKSGGDCPVLSPPLSSLNYNEVGGELIRNCVSRDIRFTHGASKRRYWNVHAQHWTIFKECVFDVEWEFAATGKVYDCRPETIGLDKFEKLKKDFLYPDKLFTTYVDDIQVNVLTPEVNLHNGYVKVYPSLPSRAFRSDPGQEYAANPKFYINVELWTGGECSGRKSPGVRWVFTYQVDPGLGTIKYITKFDKNNHRPYVNHKQKSYVWDLKDTSETRQKKLVTTYQEKVIGWARHMGLNVKRKR